MIPKTESDVADIIRAAKSPISIRGGGSRGVSIQGDPVVTTGLNGITLYEPGSLTLVAQAGTPVAEIETALNAEGQRLAFEPMDPRGLTGFAGTPTIGGVVASNNSGPRRVSVGACRDFLLGVRFVDGIGREISNGGRVMKNVTGYDLAKLMAGSWGTLGIMTEVSLKVLPKPEMTGVLLLNGLDDQAAVALMSKALGSPYEVTGAAHAPAGKDGHPVTMLRLEGFEESVTYRMDALRRHLASEAETVIETSPEKTAAGWKWVRDVELFHGRPGNVWRIAVKPSDAPTVVSQVNHDGVLYDWGGGLIWLLCPEDEDVRSKTSNLQGHATLVRGSGHASFHPEPAAIAKLSKGLRAKFDPRGLFNQGLMG